LGEHVAMEVRQVDDAMLVERLSRTAKLPGDENVVLVQRRHPRGGQVLLTSPLAPIRKGGESEPLTERRPRRGFTRERALLRSADTVRRSGMPHSVRRQRKVRRGSAVRDPSMPDTPHARTTSSSC